MARPRSPSRAYDEADEEARHFSFERKVPLGLIAIIISQTVLFAAFVARMDQRIDEIERDTPEASRVAVLEVVVSNNTENINRLEERTVRSLDEIKSTLREINGKLDVHNESPHPSGDSSAPNFP